MSNQPERGHFLADPPRMFTFFFALLAGFVLVFFVMDDLGAGGHRYLSTAFGTVSNGWIWAWVMVCGFISMTSVGVVSRLYTQYTERIFAQDQIGFAKSGGQDVGFWSGFLCYIATLFVFARFLPPGTLGFLRPFALALVVFLSGTTLARIVARRLFSALYGPPLSKASQSERRDTMRLQCQQIYRNNQRCQRATYGDEEVCRWHKVLRESRADVRRMGRWTGSVERFASAGLLLLGGAALWRFIQTPDAIIWLLIAFFGLGLACFLFAEGIMAEDYPLYQFAFWPQLWATGMVMEIVGSFIGAVYLLISPQAGLSAVRAVFGSAPQWLIYGLPPLLVLWSALNLRLLIKRVLFYRHVHIIYILWFGIGLAGLAVALVERH